MMVRTIGFAATLALAAEAIMLPPNVAVPGLTEVNAAADPHSDLVKVACPGCPFAEGKEVKTWIEGVENSLLLRFEVEGDMLTMNGAQIYPPVSVFNKPESYVGLSTFQVPSDLDLEQLQAHPELASAQLSVTGYTLGTGKAETIDESGTELLPMAFQIFRIEEQSVNPPRIIINLMKTADGGLSILDINSASPTPSVPIESHAEECKDWPLLCKWKAIIADKIELLKHTMHKGKKGPCKGKFRPHGKPPHVSRPPMNVDDEEPSHPEHPHHRPHGPHHHGHHGHKWGHHGHRHHKLMRALHVVMAVLIPIMIGVAFGMAGYLLGMVIGCIIAAIYIRFRGAQSSQYEGVAQDEEAAPAYVEGEKETYVESAELDAEALPVYQEKEAVN